MALEDYFHEQEPPQTRACRRASGATPCDSTRMAADGWGGYGKDGVGLAYTRGAPVLKWAGARIREDKALVEFLVWANPSNLCFASPALQADAEVVAAALASPFYDQEHPRVPVSCVLRFADERLRASKDVVLAAVARSGHELEFAGEALRADPYVVAWAGAPVGAADTRALSKTFMRLLKSGVSVEHMDANWKRVMEDADCCATFNCHDYRHWIADWPKKPPGVRKPYHSQFDNKHAVCYFLKDRLSSSCPLCLRVAPPVRELLWPTREEWDGRF